MDKYFLSTFRLEKAEALLSEGFRGFQRVSEESGALLESPGLRQSELIYA
ncbi:4-Hydroxy-3-methylbut-2-enyl diphosphate reductase IspH [Pseudomonas syringae pv. actinidiae]|uniref:4-Hydroxy-3-methylbut-2-enyl diphosphate reductase IspH n=1 Tax=Pseudomonas syringae pv. actinidiae TaxID=103796 RepID=A0AAN4QCA3_PSESF|nr:4-Hydroxy-3-methylbut-2-enyl diphosphate reductase IspH [Pseudomonas syringae pv. actinidiae]